MKINNNNQHWIPRNQNNWIIDQTTKLSNGFYPVVQKIHKSSPKKVLKMSPRSLKYKILMNAVKSPRRSPKKRSPRRRSRSPRNLKYNLLMNAVKSPRRRSRSPRRRSRSPRRS